MNYKDLTKVNGEIKTVSVKGKNYAEVKERVNAFRKLYPEGFIETEILEIDENHFIIKASVGIWKEENYVVDCAGSEISKYESARTKCVLATGTACEYKGASNINKTSYVENCETSAVGRALGMLGIGIDVALASADEMRGSYQEAEPVMKPLVDPELQAVKEEFAATVKNHGLNGIAICNQFGIGTKPTAEQLLVALEAIAVAIETNNIPEAWRIK